MRVTLPKKLAELVQQKLSGGDYASAEEVIAAALKLLEQRDQRLVALRKDIQDGLASGPGRPFDEESVRDIKEHGRERLTQSKNPG